MSGDLNAYTVSGCTKAVVGRALRVTRTGAGPYVQSPAGKAEPGQFARYMWVRAVKITGASPVGQTFSLRYARSGTGAHGISTSHRKDITIPAGKAVGDTIDLFFDMFSLTAGGTDWRDGIVDQWRLYLPDEVGSVWDLYLVSPANMGATRNTGPLAGDSPQVTTPLVKPQDIVKSSLDTASGPLLLPKKNLTPPNNWILLNQVTLTLSGYGDIAVEWTANIDYAHSNYAYISLLIDNTPTFDGAGVINNWDKQIAVRCASSAFTLPAILKHKATGFAAGSHTFSVYGQQDNNAAQHAVLGPTLGIDEFKT